MSKGRQAGKRNKMEGIVFISEKNELREKALSEAKTDTLK